jgi:uncharacterized protein YdeI (YjbR/CyaY-like superfamily)
MEKLLAILIHDVLNKRGLMEAYGTCPPYQQNDYVCLLCVTRAKQEPTKQKRLDQMLNELENGDVYMNVKWNPK